MSRAGRRIVVALAMAAAGTAVAAAASQGVSPLGLVPVLPAGLPFVIAGVASANRRSDEPSGPLLAACGLSWLGAQAFFAVDHRVAFIGSVLFPLGLAFLAHLAPAYPDGLKSRGERVVVALPYGLVMALLPLAVAGDEDFITAGAEGTFERAWYVGLLVAALVTAVCFLVILVGRWRQGTAVARRVLLPVVPGDCLFVLIYIVALLAELGVPTGLGGRWGLLGILLGATAPLVFLAGLLRARLVRTKVGGLVVELGSTPGGGLRDALARALRDPTVEVAYWIPEEDRYVDEHGRGFELPEPGGPRKATRIERAGRPVGALIHDAALGEDQDHVDAVCAAAGLALENQRLHAEVLARLDEVRGLEGAHRRSGRHGPQAGRAQPARRYPAAPGGHLHRFGDGPLQALPRVSGRGRCAGRPGVAGRGAGDHRAQGADPWPEPLHPRRGGADGRAGVSGGALVPARDAAGGDHRLPARLRRAAAYYGVAEALSNAAKHAGASSVRVLVEEGPDRLAVEVADDGSGGAGVRSGGGLEGLADRVAALDGRLVESHPGGGTVVRAELPCV